MEELVFAVPTVKLWELISYKEEGFISGNTEVLNKLIQNGLFRRRSELEGDPSFKQLIPYAILSNEDSYYLFKRTSGQTEKRLHNKFTLGVGGHMNPGNSIEKDEQYLIDELKRELFEEVRFSDSCVIKDIKFIGFINDDSIPVGRHHIGILYSIRLSGKDIAINEPDKMTAHWVNEHELADNPGILESWSRIAFDYHIRP